MTTHRILIVDDDVRFCELYGQVLASAGFIVETAHSTQAAIQRMTERPPSLVVSDVRMPGESGIELFRWVRGRYPTLPFLLVTAYADVRDAVMALKLGAADYLAKPVDLDELLAAVQDALDLRRDPALGLDLPKDALGEIVVYSPAMMSLFRDALRVAASDANVLITGESGSGKEVVAAFIHRNSPRRQGPLVAVNCAAIPETLLASELFGHEKGAFTGALTRRLGVFRQAAGGTLFLDEIGDMPLALQPALLRAIETGRVTPVGGDRELAVDYRLVAATHRNLGEAAADGRFRLDLFYRLNVIALDVPPLRERSEDILPLARHFLAKDASASKRLSRAAANALLAHPWPGNVRELANAMERARLLSQSDVVLPEHLPPAVRDASHALASSPPEIDPLPADLKTLQESEMDTIEAALLQTGGNRTRAAALLGITRRGLIYKLKRLGLG